MPPPPPVVVCEQTAQTLRAGDLVVRVLRSRLYHPSAKPHVGLLLAVELKIFTDGISQLLLTGQDEVIEAFANASEADSLIAATAVAQ